MIILEEALPLELPVSVPSDRQKWDSRFLGVAHLISTWSKDPSTKVGAVAVNLRRRILAQGYNGFPSGAKDLDVVYERRESKYKMIVHAESNIIYNACRFRVGLESSIVYVYGQYPCPECVKALAQVGVGRIVFQLGHSDNSEFWEQAFIDSRDIMHQLGIGFTHYKWEPLLDTVYNQKGN